MYNQWSGILEKYNFTVEEMNRGRGAYILHTDQGLMLLKEFTGSVERANFVANVLKELQEKGMCVEQVIMSKEGEPLTEDEAGTRYLVKTVLVGQECSVRAKDEMKNAMKALANYHNIVKDCNACEAYRNACGKNLNWERMQRHNRELVKIKNYIRTKNKKNAFEQEFLKCFPYFMEKANFVCDLWEKKQIPQEAWGLTHGNFHQHNVVFYQGQVYLLNFEDVKYGLVIDDAANFIRKMMEKNHWDYKLGRELMDAYEQQHPLLQVERELLALELAYPEKFWKIANHYYNSHKAWIPQRDIEKLGVVWQEEERRRLFLEKMLQM